MSGGRHALGEEARQAVWDLYEAYSRGLRERGVVDFKDLVLMARDAVRKRPLEGYDAVIIDEAQDRSCAMVSFPHALVGDRADGLTLIGDGQQTIYPGGYTLGEVGINIAGRGVMLEVNHRNRAEVLDFAKAMVASDGVDGAGDAVSAVTRSGSPPVGVRSRTRADHDEAMVARVRSVLQLVGVGRGDVGILVGSNREESLVMSVLSAPGLPSVSLQKYDGRTVDAVKVGTIKRAKGLEFKQVLLANVSAGLLADAPASLSETDQAGT